MQCDAERGHSNNGRKNRQLFNDDRGDSALKLVYFSGCFKKEREGRRFIPANTHQVPYICDEIAKQRDPSAFVN